MFVVVTGWVLFEVRTEFLNIRRASSSSISDSIVFDYLILSPEEAKDFFL
jgi:hypothetical protein